MRLDLLDLMGRGYVIQHCIAALRAENRETQYRAYVTDALKVIAENTSKHIIPGTGVVDVGSVLIDRWVEQYAEQHNKETSQEDEDGRTCGEIVRDMWERIGGGKSERI